MEYSYYTVDSYCFSILYIVVGIYFNPKLLVYPGRGSSLVNYTFIFSVFESVSIL